MESLIAVCFPGGDFSCTFTEVGDFEYYCLIHPWMVGTITNSESEASQIKF